MTIQELIKMIRERKVDILFSVHQQDGREIVKVTVGVSDKYEAAALCQDVTEDIDTNDGLLLDEIITYQINRLK